MADPDPKHWPAWRWSGDQGRIFDCPEDVPEGWVTAHERNARKISPPDLDGDGKPGGSLPDPERTRVITALEEKGIQFDRRKATAKLAALLEG